jgi:hypothetical protein
MAVNAFLKGKFSSGAKPPQAGKLLFRTEPFLTGVETYLREEKFS